MGNIFAPFLLEDGTGAYVGHLLLPNRFQIDDCALHAAPPSHQQPVGAFLLPAVLFILGDGKEGRGQSPRCNLHNA